MLYKIINTTKQLFTVTYIGSVPSGHYRVSNIMNEAESFYCCRKKPIYLHRTNKKTYFVIRNV